MSPDELTYEGSSGRSVSFDLNSIFRVGDGDTLRSRSWSRTLCLGSLADVSRAAREVSVEVCATPDAADEARRVFELDMSRNSPGSLVMGGWSQRALVPESKSDTWRPGIVCLTLTVALLDGVWRRGSLTHFLPDDGPIELGDGKGYPHGYPYSYGSGRPGGVEIPGYLPSPARIVIFGPTTNPTLTIGGNEYSYSGAVPSGAHLVIDGVALTATLVAEDGTETNAMPGVSLGDGEGSGSYAFQPVEPGWNDIGWDGSFGFDLECFEEEGEPPWTSS